MKKASYSPLVLTLLLLASGAAAADDAAVLKCRALSDGALRLACYDAMPVAAFSSPVAPAAAPTRSAEQDFGIQKTTKKEEAEFIESTVVGDFDGWEGNTRITLANGQVWRIADDSIAALPLMHNPKVRIKRGVLGALYFQVVGQNNTARVRRVQ